MRTGVETIVVVALFSAFGGGGDSRKRSWLPAMWTFPRSGARLI
jgi:hypothetical protein